MTILNRILGDTVAFVGRALSVPEDFRSLAASYGVDLREGTIQRSDLEVAFPIGSALTALNVALSGDDMSAVANSIDAFAAVLNVASRRPVVTLPHPLGENWFLSGVVGRCIVDRFFGALVDEYPSALPWLALIGVADDDDVYVKNLNGIDGVVWRGRMVRVRFDRLPLLLRPDELLRQVYRWGGEFDYETAAVRIAHILQSLGGCVASLSALSPEPIGDALQRSMAGEADPLIVGFGPSIVDLSTGAAGGASEPHLVVALPGALGVLISRLPRDEREGVAGLGLRLYLGDEAGDPVSSPVRIQVGAVGTYGLHLRPSSVRFVGSVAGTLRVTVDLCRLLGREENEPLVLGGATRLSLEALAFSIGVSSSLSTSGGVDVSMMLEARRGRFVISAGEGDGFLQRLLPADGLSVEFEFGAGWSMSRGFHFRGGASLDATFPLRVSILGVLEVVSIHLRLTLTETGLRTSASLSFRAELGPLSVVVNQIGARVALTFPSGGGNFGPADISSGFQSPNGLSLSLQAGPVRGGGVIAYDETLGRYSGALALSIGSIALRAIGILDTRAPGVSGYSFLIVISAEFSPIQLGFGFTLMGVGGLCGIQRSISVPALQSGVRDGSLAPLLFCRDPIAQAAQLITGLQRIFPPTNDRYVFGPMFKLGWGTPTLVTADVGIVLQVPSPIVIVLLGTLSATLPRPEAAVVVLNLDIVGVLEVTEKRLSIDASLRDSRVAAFTLTGDMALRFSWGPEPDFALSIGGFNPAFRPPPSFPTLRRLSLALGNGANPRLSLAAYLAITSNSLQFGARAELYATAAGFTVQGYLEFHALFIFRPFSFQFDFAAGLSLKRGNSVLAAITVTGQLKGPRPWYIKATASITVLFFDVSVNIERTFGEAAPPELATPVDVWTRLLPALADVRNWSASLPEGRPRGVSTAADRETPPRVRLDPMSQLAVRQKVLPLDRRITKLGEAVIGPAARFRIRAVRAGTGAGGDGGTLLPTGSVNEPFAAAQYQTLTDAERLSSPSFQPMAAGVEALGAAVRTGGSRPAPVRWRTLLLEPRAGEEAQAPRDVSARMAGKMGAVDAAKDAGLRATGMERFAPSAGTAPTATLEPERWTLASTRDLDARPGAEASAAWGTSAEALRELPAGERGRWQVVPSWEVRR